MKICVIGLGALGRATLEGFRCFSYDVCGYDKDMTRTEVKAIGYADIYFICTHEQVVEDVLSKELRNKRGLVVIRSTTPPNTIASLQHKYNRHICHNPEFLREANALSDFMFPDRIIIGECCKEHGDLLETIYRPFNAPIIRVSSTASEMIKITANAWLTTQINFWNSVRNKCEYLGLSPQAVANAVTCDKRISKYGSKMTGGNAGGKCLPKDFKYWNGVQ